MDKERFSLLLLEPNEIYFEDFSVELSNIKDTKPDKNSIIGHLKVCSKSLVFDPKDIKLPLLKIPYKNCENITVYPDDENYKNPVLTLRCSQYIEMLENNVLSPYKFIQMERNFYFHFHYVNINDYVAQICQLYRASSLHISEQNSMIAAIVFSRHNREKFNPLWLENIYENNLFDGKVDEINPLVVNPGRLLLTNSNIYFQPYNNIQPYPVLKIKLSNVISLNKKRFLLRHIGLEIKWQNDKEEIFYISFRNTFERNTFFDKVLEQKDVKIKEIKPESMTLKWQNRIISNYDYLLYLNGLADRSFQDLTQYPVFPWVIQDYTSKELDLKNESIYRDLTKPIGALNPERLGRLKERCEEMPNPKFLYGSHYSTPGFVLFYLVRKYPHLMLCLQNGRFDHPDRMFNKMEDTFNNCLTNMSDFKELIPEFYDTSQKGDFLLNVHKINFGCRNDGSSVNNVILPPWADFSPEKFVQILRDALESDYVSQNLHHWIDLIFGYKQLGEEAAKSDNLFYYLCYEGSVDLDSIKDIAARDALEVQISEFGQIPKQLFKNPHVARHTYDRHKEESPIRNSLNLRDKLFELNLQLSYVAHKESITYILIDGDTIISTGKDGSLKFYKISEKRQIRSVSFGSLALSSCFKIPNSSIFIIGSWDNTIFLYNCDYGKVTDTIPAHDDAVSCLNFIEDLGIVISGSWDCSVKVWKGFSNINHKPFRISDSMVAYLSLEDKAVCLETKIENDKIQIIIGTDVGDVLLWEIDIIDRKNLSNLYANEAARTLVKHNGEISYLAFNTTRTKLASSSLNGCLNVTDLSTGMNLFVKILPDPANCLNWCDESDYLLVGTEVGNLMIWDLTEGKLKCDKNVSNGAVTCIRYFNEQDLIITAGKDDSEYRIKCWSFN